MLNSEFLAVPSAPAAEIPISATVPFKFGDLHPWLQKAVTDLHWSEATPVQQKAIVPFLEGHDLMVQSHTGSGKTGAFLLPISQLLDARVKGCQTLILVPTRELANQVYQEFVKINLYSDLKAVAVYGGVGYGPQIEAFKNGHQVVVGTPGRILDHLEQGTLNFNQVRFVVFDEADEMLSMGFYPDMRRIKRFLPRQRQSAMFSATLPQTVQSLAREFLNTPQIIGINAERVHIDHMDHIYYMVDAMQKDRTLMAIIELENPDSAIIFCNTKRDVEYLTTVFQRFGYDVDQLTGDLSQARRDQVMARVKGKKLRFLIATDIAARGIDISLLTHVFHYTVPEDVEIYIHRSGRTARAGASGTSIALASVLEEMQIKKISKTYNIEMERRLTPDAEQVQNRVAERLMVQLEQQLRDLDRAQRERMQRFIPLAKALTASNAEPELLAMLLDKVYLQMIHNYPVEPVAPVLIEPSASDRPPARHRDGHSQRRPQRGSRGGRR